MVTRLVARLPRLPYITLKSISWANFCIGEPKFACYVATQW